MRQAYRHALGISTRVLGGRLVPGRGAAGAVASTPEPHPAHQTGAAVQEQIQGTTMPVLSVQLNPGESVVAETGEFSWMTDTIQMSTGVAGGMTGRGLMGALKRAAGGATLMMSTYTAQGGPGTISFATKMPGGILPVDVGPGAEFMIHRHGFLAGTPGIQLTAGFQQSFRAGIFAGEGFILQRAGGQ